ncbi:MAG: hypothetical protein WD716_06765 [Fimbriimonadaceae bacterium]
MYGVTFLAIGRIVALVASGALLFVSLTGTYSPDPALERKKIELYDNQMLICPFGFPTFLDED